jgi:hypothetical protein
MKAVDISFSSKRIFLHAINELKRIKFKKGRWKVEVRMVNELKLHNYIQIEKEFNIILCNTDSEHVTNFSCNIVIWNISPRSEHRIRPMNCSTCYKKFENEIFLLFTHKYNFKAFWVVVNFKLLSNFFKSRIFHKVNKKQW